VLTLRHVQRLDLRLQALLVEVDRNTPGIVALGAGEESLGKKKKKKKK